jgi:hypothetical protein
MNPKIFELFEFCTTEIRGCSYTAGFRDKASPLSRVPHNRDRENEMTGFALQSLSLRWVEHSTPQQINVGPAKHLPLEHLQTVNVTLHRTRAPG